MQSTSWLSSFLSFNWRVQALFFLGAAARKAGLFGRGHGKLHRVLPLDALPVGAMLELRLLGSKAWIADPSSPERMGQAFIAEVGSLVLSAAYIGAVLWRVHAGQARRVQSAFAAVGRTAPTNRLLPSVFMSVIFYGFGLGLWNALSPLAVLGIAAELFLVQVGASVPCMRTFAIGPVEWLCAA